MLLVVLLIRFLEESEALRKLGDAYQAYRRAVPMFSLRRDCLRRLFADPPPARPAKGGRP